MLLYRHAQLVIRHLSGHPDAKQIQNKSTLQQATKDVNNNLKKLEQLKPRINKRYERYEELIRNRNLRQKSVLTVRQSDLLEKSPQHTTYKQLLPDDGVNIDAETLAASENPDLAVQLAHKEIRRRATARKATRQAGITEEIENERRTAGVWGNWEDALSQNDSDIDQDTLSRQMQNVRAQINGSGNSATIKIQSHPSFTEAHLSDFNYPQVPEHHREKDRSASFDSHDLPSNQGTKSRISSLQPPRPPPKDDRVWDSGSPRAGPARPDKTPITPDTPRAVEVSTAHQDLKPSALTFKPSAYLENGSPLRTIFLPPDLRHRFLKIAKPNTQANLETCGILCGTLISNALFVSKLVIPDQKSTSDTCETVNEGELFDYVDGEDLMVLGWIHTHPTQTCFMSSRDLHTHGGYQVMMPESIAIVCAPSKGDWGVFRLTDPPGMKAILNCTQTGLFHPHAESDIYTDALRPGHVYEAKGLEFEVVDLRPRNEDLQL